MDGSNLLAPDFELPSATGAPVSLHDLIQRRPVVLLFVSEECPTCAMTLRRLAPVVGALEEAGVVAAAIFEDPLEIAARTARRARFPGIVLSEPEPYATSRAYALETVPTAVLVEPGGQLAGRVVGWDVDGLRALLRRALAAVGDAHTSLELCSDPPERKPGCAAKSTLDAEALEAMRGGFDELEEMFERGWTDGLPVIPPTPGRVQAMLGGRDGSECLGEVPPGMGAATLERIASCAVLAGCRPDYFPVVLAAARAALEPAFNLAGQAVTTQPAGQVLIVNGPVGDAIGLNGSIGALGPGWRANMTIGRALRLLVTLTGGGYPGRLDRATLGHVGKLAMCFAEDEEVSPWEPLHVERGFGRERSVVTLLAADAPLSISDHRSASPQELARVLGWAAAATWSPNWWPLGGHSLFVICPEHASLFAAAGWDKQRVREHIFEAVQRPARELRWGETTPLVNGAADDRPIHKWDSPADIILVVAGGEAGRYSAVFGPCLGMNAEIVTKEIAWNT
jgi:thiol-disulfide isomerase/thioredoxin